MREATFRIGVFDRTGERVVHEKEYPARGSAFVAPKQPYLPDERSDDALALVVDGALCDLGEGVRLHVVDRDGEHFVGSPSRLQTCGLSFPLPLRGLMLTVTGIGQLSIYIDGRGVDS